MGLARVFALTYQDVFFEKLGFKRCAREIFPQKVWVDCRTCSKQHACDEIAMLRVLDVSRVDEEGLPLVAAIETVQERAPAPGVDVMAQPGTTLYPAESITIAA
jgi:hypothetical protein